MRDENVEDLLASEHEGEDVTDSEGEECEPEEDDTWCELASEEFLEDWGDKLEHTEQSANQESVGDLTNALAHCAHGGTAKGQRDKLLTGHIAIRIKIKNREKRCEALLCPLLVKCPKKYCELVLAQSPVFILIEQSKYLHCFGVHCNQKFSMNKLNIERPADCS